MNRELAAFLRERELARFLDAVRVKFERHAVGGTAVVADPTPAEVNAVVKLFGADGRKLVPAPGRPLAVPLRALEAALVESRFRCGVQEALSAYYGVPILPRAEQRAWDAERWEAFVDRIAGLAPEHERCTRWLQALRARQVHTAYISRLLAQGDEAGAEGLALIVLRALAALPADAEAAERLAVFANRMAGNPHLFDEGTFGGLALLRALEFEFGEAIGVTRSRGRAESERVLEAAGLLRDLVSSFATVAGTLAPLDQTGRGDPAVVMVPGRARLFTLAEVQAWASVTTSPVVHVVENPVVFEALCEVAGAHTVVCTRGFPSLATIRLLGLIVRSGGQLRYAGDFDGNGLTIARLVLSRYRGRCEPWRMTADVYAEAVHQRGRKLSGAERKRVEQMAEWFPSLVAAMMERNAAAYQEGVIHLLQADLLEHHA